MRLLLGVSSVLLGVLVCDRAVVSAQATPPIDADAIFSRAQAVWAAQVYPTDISYAIVVRAGENGVDRFDHYAGEVLVPPDDRRVQAFSDEEQAHPAVPHGTNVVATVSVGYSSGRAPVGQDNAANRGQAASLSIPLSKPPAPTDLLGIPDLDPVYSFGLRRVERMQPTATSPRSDEPRIIGKIVVEQRRYRVTFVGLESLDGTDAFHLALVPLRQPGRYRLRDLWVASATYATLKARVAGNFTTAPASTIPWTITFAQIDGATYIDREVAEAPMSRGGHTFTAEVRFDRVLHNRGPRSLRFAIPAELDSPLYLREPEP